MTTLASPTTSPLDQFKLSCATHVSRVFSIPLETAYLGIESGKTGKTVKGDFTVAVPRFRLKGNPADWAKKLVDELNPDEFLESAEATGGFVSFKIVYPTLTKLLLGEINKRTYLEPLLPETPFPSLDTLSLNESSTSPKFEKPDPSLVLFKTGGFGTNLSGEGKKILFDFSSPNIAKPFHAGHLRSTIIGAFLANLYEANGYQSIRLNYLGDWGKQFGVLAVGFEKYGSEEELEKDAITHLYDVYVKINADGEKDPKVHDRAREFFVGMENGDEAALALWGKFRDLSIAKYKSTYARLNIYFDIYSGESQVSNLSQKLAIDALQKIPGLTEESDGALIVDLEKYKLGKTILRKKDGTFVYITRDIGGAKERWDKYGFEKSIYVVASQQDLHNAQLFKVLDLMGYPWASKLSHINFGMVKGMSTRKGTAVFLEQILNESRDVMHEQMKKNEDKYNSIEDPEKASDVLGITAVKIQDMAGRRVLGYDFNWNRMTSFEGDTGPYLQYAHVRLSSVERKNAPTLILPPPSERPSKIDTSYLTDPAAQAIVMLLATFPDVVKSALIASEPSTIVTWCFRLTHAISSAWESLRVKVDGVEEEGEVRERALARLWLFVCAKDVLANAMKMLTLEPLEKM